MIQISSEILSNRPICTGFYEMTFAWERGTVSPLPGQFFTVRVSEDTVPLLRRPFAFSEFDPSTSAVSMIYQKRGRGTELLAARSAGDTICVIGPLGRPFPVFPEKSSAVLVAGGIGISPLAFLAAYLRSQKISTTLVFGSKSADFIPDSAVFKAFSPVICTDDGSAGFKGTTVEFLRTITGKDSQNCVLYCCGPLPMLKGCHELAISENIPCFVSVEQIMACGVGACMGCAVKVNRDGGFARACVEGPVFNSSEINWD